MIKVKSNTFCMLRPHKSQKEEKEEEEIKSRTKMTATEGNTQTEERH